MNFLLENDSVCKISRNKNFLKLLKKYILIFSKFFDQFFQICRQSIFAKLRKVVSKILKEFICILWLILRTFYSCSSIKFYIVCTTVRNCTKLFKSVKSVEKYINVFRCSKWDNYIHFCRVFIFTCDTLECTENFSAKSNIHMFYMTKNYSYIINVKSRIDTITHKFRPPTIVCI